MLFPEPSREDAPRKPRRATGITRRRGACQGCKLKKIRCNGARPCSACDRTGHDCTYESNRKPTPGKESDQSTAYEEGLGQVCYSTPKSVDSDTRQSTSALIPIDGPLTLFDSGADLESWLSPEALTFPAVADTPGSIATPLDEEPEIVVGESQPAVDPVLLSVPFDREDSKDINTFDKRAGTRILSEYLPSGTDIDPRFTHSFGLADLPSSHHAGSKHGKISDILHRLTESLRDETGIPTSRESVLYSSETTAPPVRSIWRNEENATIRRYIQACFDNDALIPMFLRKSDVEKRMREAQQLPSQSKDLSLIFSDAITSLGAYALRQPSSYGRPADTERFRTVLDSSSQLQECSSTFLKLQTVVVLSIIASLINDRRLPCLLSKAVDCTRELRFNNIAVIKKSFENPVDRDLAKRTVWTLYHLETNYSVYRGTAPLLHAECINHIPTTPEGLEGDPLALLTAATSLLATCLNRVYSHALSARTTDELQACEATFSQWTQCLPDDVRLLLRGHRFDILCPGPASLPMLHLLCCYHECVCMLAAPWLQPLLSPIFQDKMHRDDGDTSITANRSDAVAEVLDRCLDSAYVVVSHANTILSLDKTLKRRLQNLVVISTCIVSYGVLYGDERTGNEASVYLGICCGAFSKMHLADSSIPFKDMLDLVRFIREDE